GPSLPAPLTKTFRLALRPISVPGIGRLGRVKIRLQINDRKSRLPGASGIGGHGSLQGEAGNATELVDAIGTMRRLSRKQIILHYTASPKLHSAGLRGAKARMLAFIGLRDRGYDRIQTESSHVGRFTPAFGGQLDDLNLR